VWTKHKNIIICYIHLSFYPRPNSWRSLSLSLNLWYNGKISINDKISIDNLKKEKRWVLKKFLGDFQRKERSRSWFHRILRQLMQKGNDDINQGLYFMTHNAALRVNAQQLASEIGLAYNISYQLVIPLCFWHSKLTKRSTTSLAVFYTT